ncbi:alpha-ketoglutarate-dependent dioxygenase AlkB [Halomonas sp. 18H]|uniref:alpha-ketoglutarate-dependent dioxygenase AlkB family protein n=1 Tax=Halomonas almeriensis TaxID=308163 RepID=UPI00222E5AFD|nr:MULTISPECIES: alpha-ketoglutarate-dependent dioxygenase AlkB [Halomonas]MCW4151813.1 alpha-ketoglutarate-dependent dioxygenase AlkB [Halomonas sp. 18H]MDN3554059.1 alpha-ketoglutarate-dependent dioxygenase AlkB [Halomonas almeriensis]
MTAYDPENFADFLLKTPPLVRFRHLLGQQRADRMLQCLNDELAWQQPRLRLFGREHPIPRHQVWMGDAAYRYSGQDFEPEEWHPGVMEIRQALQERLQQAGFEATFNSVLINRYAHGQHRMGWHSDNEPELGARPLIASLSLGRERPLRFRWKDRRAPAFNIDQPDDSVLMMGPGVQSELEHSLPDRKGQGLRISLTFRWIHY